MEEPDLKPLYALNDSVKLKEIGEKYLDFISNLLLSAMMHIFDFK